MTIDFPCLQKDISFWFPKNSNSNEIVRNLEKFLTISGPEAREETIVVQPKSNNINNWLDNKKSKLGDDESDSKTEFNIMSPVLKDTPNSVWLAGKTQNTETVKEKREADLTTSIWLATSSSEPFTCVTRSTNNAAAIQWPSILFQDSPNVWLPQVERNDIDQWLAKKNASKNANCGQESSMTESVFDNWNRVQGSSKAWSVQDEMKRSYNESDQEIEEIHDKWIELGSNKDLWNKVDSTREEDQLEKIQWNNPGPVSNWIMDGTSDEVAAQMDKKIQWHNPGPVSNWIMDGTSEEEDQIEGDAKSYVEKWLCLAANEDLDPSSEDMKMNDDESSIAILSFGDETDNDYDMVDDQDKQQGSWLF